jgi:hypothetical protein
VHFGFKFEWVTDSAVVQDRDPDPNLLEIGTDPAAVQDRDPVRVHQKLNNFLERGSGPDRIDNIW